MNTEVKDTEAQVAAAPASPNGEKPQPASPEAQPNSLGRWRQPRIVAAATVAILLVIGSVVGFNLVARQYTPDGAVRAYLGALQAGDASTAWAQVQVEAPTASATATLTDQASMRAALAVGRPDIKSFSIDGTTDTNTSTAIVKFTYATSSGGKQAQFVVVKSGQTRFGIFAVWRVLLTPTLLQINLPGGSGPVSIDGKRLSLAAGKLNIAVLPVFHNIQFAGTQILAASSLSVDAFFSQAQAVAYSPKLTEAGVAKVKAAVKAGFESCSRQTSANARISSPCPQDIQDSFNLSGQWSVVGDPIGDMAVSFDQAMNASAVGHYQMVFAYNEDGFQAARHMVVAEGYSASLSLTASDVTIGGIKPATGIPPLTRPAGATDESAKAIVAKAFAQCAAAKVARVADCPQQLGVGGTTNVRWSMTGDPLSGATVNFDPDSGLITVHGNFRMSATYDWLGTYTSADSATVAYNADLYWDGQALQLVTIDGAYS